MAKAKIKKEKLEQIAHYEEHEEHLKEKAATRPAKIKEEKLAAIKNDGSSERKRSGLGFGGGRSGGGAGGYFGPDEEKRGTSAYKKPEGYYSRPGSLWEDTETLYQAVQEAERNVRGATEENYGATVDAYNVAVDQYNSYVADQQSKEDEWRSRVRDEAEILEDIDRLEREQSANNSKRGEIYSLGTPYERQEELDALNRAEEMLAGEERQLREELEWAKTLRYQEVQNADDFEATVQKVRQGGSEALGYDPGLYATGKGEDPGAKGLVWALLASEENKKRGEGDTAINDLSPFWEDKWGQLNEKERNILLYYVGKGQLEEAEAYLAWMEGTANTREGKRVGENIAGIDNEVLRQLASTGYGIGAGVGNSISGIAQLFSTEPATTSVSQAAMPYIEAGLKDVGFKIGGENGKSIGQYIFNAGNTVGNMLPSIVVGSFFGPGAGTAAMSASVAGNSYTQALQEGYTKEQATRYGILVGASEGILQYLLGGISKLGGGKLGSLADDALLERVAAFDRGLMRAAGTAAIKIGSEIREEELQLFLEPLIKTAVFGVEYDPPTIEEMVETAITTALSTGALESGDVVTAALTPPSLDAARAGADKIAPENGTRPAQEGRLAPDMELPAETSDGTQAPAREAGSAIAEGQQTQTPAFGENGQRVAAEIARETGQSAEEVTRQMETAYEAGRQGDIADLGEKDSAPLAEDAGEAYTGVNEGGIDDGERAIHLRESGQWADGAYPGGQVSPVETGTGRDQSWETEGRPADSGTASLTYGEEIAVNSLGIEGGSQTEKIRMVTGGETASMKAAKELGKQRGLRVFFFAGNNLHINKGGKMVSARAYITGDRVFIRVDHSQFTADQLMRHEAGHDMINKGEINPNDVRDRIARTIGKDRMDELAAKYVEAYAEAGMNEDEVWVEIICDSLGDMNIFSELEQEGDAFELLNAAKPAAEEARTERSRGPPSSEGKFSPELEAGDKAAERAQSYTYSALAAKPDMQLTVIDDTIQYAADSKTRKQIVQDAIQNAAAIGKTNESGGVSVRVDDLGASVVLSAASLRHSLDRRLSVTAPVTLQAGEILKNSILVNELLPQHENASSSYVLLGAAKNAEGEPYIVRSVVNRFTNVVASVDVLYALNAKKEPGALLPATTDKSALLTGSTISISDLLDYVNKYFPDVLPESVLRHYGHTERPAGKLGESALFSQEPTNRVDGIQEGQRAVLESIQDEIRATVQKATEDALLAGMMSQGRKDSAQYRKLEEKLYTQRQIYQEREAEIRKKRDERLRKEKAAQKEKEAKARERKTAREYRGRIERHARELSQKLLRPTDKKHIPEQFRTTVAALLDAINLESQYTIDPDTGARQKSADGLPTKRTEAFRKVREAYAELNREYEITADPELLGSTEDGIKGLFEEVIELRDVKLADMSSEQLEKVWKVLRGVEHALTTAGKTFSATKYQRTKDWADAFQRDTATRRARKGRVVEKFRLDLENPYTFFSHFGDAGKAVFRMLRDAQDRQQVMVGEITAKVREIVDEKTVKKLEREVHEFTTERGEKLVMTTAQVMELYELTKRKQAHDHLMEGGIVQPEVRAGRKRANRGNDAIKLSAKDLEAIVGSLSAEQREIADKLQQLTTTTLADWGNEAAMTVFGYKKFTGKDYWPIKTAKEGRRSNTDKNDKTLRSIKNIGLAKATVPHASNAIDVAGLFQTFSSHAGDMIDYAAWLAPMEDADRLFNFEFKDADNKRTGKTIKGILDKMAGNDAQSYWQNLMDDIQNGTAGPADTATEGFVMRRIGAARGASVGGNLRVIIQQPTAILRAMVALSPADMAAGLVGGGGWETALKYSPTAQRKDMGGFDISAPAQLKDTMFGGQGKVSKFNEAMMWGASKADALTWGRIWSACEHAVKRERKGLTGDAFYKAVGEKFAEVIDQSQVMDGVLQRSQIMRSRSSFMKQTTAFMGEPTMAMNMILRAYDNMVMEKDPAKRSKAIKGFGRAATALLVTNAVNALAQSIVDGFRDDDEDKEYWERVKAAFLGLEGDEETPWEKATAIVLKGNLADNMNPVGYIPIAKDALSLLQGYKVTRADADVFGDIITAGATFIDSVRGEGKKTVGYALKELANQVFKVFGISAGNILRDTWGIARSIAVATDNVAAQYEMEKAIYTLDNTSNTSRFMDIAYRAYEQGDMVTYQKIVKDLIDSGVKPSAIESRMRSHAKEAGVGVDAIRDENTQLAGIQPNYQTNKKEEEKFTVDSLSAEQYLAYTEDYSRLVDQVIGQFQRSGLGSMDRETAAALVDAAYHYAETTALEENSKGEFKTDVKWIEKAQDADTELGLTAAEYIMLMGEYGSAAIGADGVYAAYDVAGMSPEVYLEHRDAMGDIYADKDKNGKSISGSKRDKIEAYLETQNLTRKEYLYLLGTEYESVRNSSEYISYFGK